MSFNNVTETILNTGVYDDTIDLFESQYPVPDGISYNSYVILDEKIALFDTADARATQDWLDGIGAALGARKPDYLIISHMEPDHAANIALICEKYPEMQLVGNAKTFAFLAQFFDADFSARSITVAEGDTLSLGAHTLQFFMAPMVHWPEVMVTYEQSEKVLFSADGFGTFGMPYSKEDWAADARRYYFNIVGKYGAQTQALLKKVSPLCIEKICPLHGPVLTEDLCYYICKYDTWSRYQPEHDGVLVAYASIHGHTKAAALELAEMLKAGGVSDVKLCDLTRTDVSYALADAFSYSKMMLAACTYDGGVFPCMEEFLLHLKAKAYQSRKIALIENGTWAPMAAKKMREVLDTMKNIEICETVVTIKSSVKPATRESMKKLVKELA